MHASSRAVPRRARREAAEEDRLVVAKPSQGARCRAWCRTANTTRDGVRVARRAVVRVARGRVLGRGGGRVSPAPLWWKAQRQEWRGCGAWSKGHRQWFRFAVGVGGWLRARQLKTFLFLEVRPDQKKKSKVEILFLIILVFGQPCLAIFRKFCEVLEERGTKFELTFEIGF